MVPLQDLVVQKADLVLFSILAGFICQIVIPDFGCNLVVFGDMFEIEVAIVLSIMSVGDS